MSEYEEDVYYKIIDPENGYEEGSLATIELIEGDFAGTQYSYGNVSFEEEKENNDLIVSFDYTIHTSNGEGILSEDSTKDKFDSEISNVLNSIILSAIKTDMDSKTDES